jgi:PAT family beta-lactamase induction signal transducer AmpG
MNKRLLTIFVLGFSSGLPMALVSSTLQAWFSTAGMSVWMTGMLSLVGLPYVYRMLWAPIVDRYSLMQLGKRRGWILCMQLSLVIGFNILSWFSPEHHPIIMASLGLMLAFCSSTQDTAIDAHRIEYLPNSEHGIGASLAVFGYRLAMLASGGFALILAQHYGWSFTYRAMGLLMVPGIISVILSREPPAAESLPVGVLETFWAPLRELICRKGWVSLLFFIFFYKLGEAFTASTSGIMMPFLIQGLGFSLDTIGIVNKVIGVVALLMGGLVSGILLIRYSLYAALLGFGLLQAVTNLLFVLLAMKGNDVILFSIAVVGDNLAAGMGTTALVAFIMRIVDKRHTATQFALFVSISALPRVLSGPLSAVIQSYFGWVGLFESSCVFALCFLPFLSAVHRAIQNDQYGENNENNIPIRDC